MLVRTPNSVIPALMFVLVAIVASGCVGPAASGGTAARNASPPPKVTLSAPASLGSWKRAADQSSARTLAAVFTDATDTFAVRYEQAAQPPRTLIVLGATAARFQPGDATIQQDAFYTALNKKLNASHPKQPTWANGHIGGQSACADTDSLGTGYAACTWIGSGVLLAFLVQDTDIDAASREVEPL
jgi:hypothetical protein